MTRSPDVPSDPPADPRPPRRPPRPTARGLAVIGPLLALAACAAEDPPAPEAPGERVCELSLAEVDESSGLARSGTQGVWWTHNDSGGEAAIYAFDTDCAHLGTVHLAGIEAVDWEEMAGFDEGGRRWLLVADTGDNRRARRQLSLHLLPEPALGPPVHTAEVPVDRTLRFRFPDGPHDTEGLAVDPAQELILVITKDRGDGTRVLSLPLHPADEGVLTATEIARLTLGPAEDDGTRMNTAAALSPDGRSLALLTYTRVWLYTRSAGQSWAEALEGGGRTIPLPALRQAEAIDWSADGRHLLVTSEGSPMPLVRLTP